MPATQGLTSRPVARPSVSVLILFSGALFVSALLLFVVQPMFAKMVLPLLGGSPSVWTTCMLFFQAGLLAGYAYAHVMTTRLPVRWQAPLHAALVVLPLAILPFELPAGTTAAQDQPVLWLLAVLSTTVGLPFVALSATAPLLQRWFGVSRQGDPYFLYAASNAGSLAALLAYPVLVEPLLALRTQRVAWGIGYGVGAALVMLCAIAAWRAARDAAPVEEMAIGVRERIPAGQRLRWLFLAFVPSGLMLAVTTFMSSDLAVVPLLWVVPLALYLLTFIVAFGSGTAWLWPLARRLFPLLLLTLLLFVLIEEGRPLVLMLALHLATFTLVALLCHGELARSRPPVSHLTEFYVWIALGGVLGGVFNSIVAPALFTSATEYPLLLVAACAAMARREDFARVARHPRSLIRPAAAALVALTALMTGDALELPPQATIPFLTIAILLCFSVSRDAALFACGIGLLVAVGGVHRARAWGDVVEADRTFFGIYRVSEDRARGLVTLFHGTTVHGGQRLGASAPEPLTYYHRDGPIGRLLSADGRAPRSVGVIGLGIGSLAAYAGPGERWTFYEIDPAIERIARDNRYFHFLERCGGACSVTLGDARVSLERSTDAHDILILDAFSSDAIPIHLLTVEAVRVYLSRLREDGFLVFHISNRHVRLRPPLARIARDLRLTAMSQIDMRSEDGHQGYQSSEWFLMAPDPAVLTRLPQGHSWRPVTADAGPSWTDDFSSIWSALRWR